MEVQYSYTENTTAHGNTTQLHWEHNSTQQYNTATLRAHGSPAQLATLRTQQHTVVHRVSYTENTTAHGSTTQLHWEHNSTWKYNTATLRTQQHMEVQHSYSENTTAHGSTTQLQWEHNSTRQYNTATLRTQQHMEVQHSYTEHTTIQYSYTENTTAHGSTTQLHRTQQHTAVQHN